MFSLLIINIILILVDSSIGLISFEKFKNQVKNNTVHPHLHLSAVSIFHLFNSINSILSVISKVIEKILCNQSMVFFNNCQYGFRAGSSTETDLNLFIGNIL